MDDKLAQVWPLTITLNKLDCIFTIESLIYTQECVFEQGRSIKNSKFEMLDRMSLNVSSFL